MGKLSRYPPAALGGPCCSRYPPAAHGRPHGRAGGCALKEAAACGYLLLAGALASGEEPTQEQVFWQEQQLVGRTHAGTVCDGLYPVGGTPC